MSLKNIQDIRSLRQFVLKQLDGLTIAQWNKIPSGFNNNIAWNVGHMLAVQQNLCYVRSSLPAQVSDALFTPFLPGTKPERYIDDSEISEMCGEFISAMDRTEADYQEGIFKMYEPVARVAEKYGVQVQNIDHALTYLLHHEGFHTGYIICLKRMVTLGE